MSVETRSVDENGAPLGGGRRARAAAVAAPRPAAARRGTRHLVLLGGLLDVLLDLGLLLLQLAALAVQLAARLVDLALVLRRARADGGRARARGRVASASARQAAGGAGGALRATRAHGRAANAFSRCARWRRRRRRRGRRTCFICSCGVSVEPNAPILRVRGCMRATRAGAFVACVCVCARTCTTPRSESRSTRRAGAQAHAPRDAHRCLSSAAALREARATPRGETATRSRAPAAHASAVIALCADDPQGGAHRRGARRRRVSAAVRPALGGHQGAPPAARAPRGGPGTRTRAVLGDPTPASTAAARRPRRPPPPAAARSCSASWR